MIDPMDKNTGQEILRRLERIIELLEISNANHSNFTFTITPETITPYEEPKTGDLLNYGG